MNRSIVIVDDYDLTVKVIEQNIKFWDVNANVITATSCKEALKLFNGQHIDMVITDYNLPENSGLDLTQNLREMADYENVPVVLITGNNNIYSEMQNKYADVFDEIVKKPFKVKQFHAILDKYLK